MKVITAVEEYKRQAGDITCFLAGGITNCDLWQDEVIDHLKEILKDEDTDDFIVFNPRRKNFPIGVPGESERQITWEFNRLQESDIFSMYFCNSNSDQPICMYELGRNLYKKLDNWTHNMLLTPANRIVISIEEGYNRQNDVIIQTKLAYSEVIDKDLSIDELPISVIKDHKKCTRNHAIKIADRYKRIREDKN